MNKRLETTEDMATYVRSLEIPEPSILICQVPSFTDSDEGVLSVTGQNPYSCEGVAARFELRNRTLKHFYA